MTHGLRCYRPNSHVNNWSDVMRALFVVFACFFLAGCPPHIKLYVHSESSEPVLVRTLQPHPGETTIRAGQTKTIHKGSESHVCFQLSIIGESRIYLIDPNSGPYIKSETFGGRLDLYIRNNRVFVQTKNGEQREIFSREQCRDT
jgi:hypothetical protein